MHLSIFATRQVQAAWMNPTTWESTSLPCSEGISLSCLHWPKGRSAASRRTGRRTGSRRRMLAAAGRGESWQAGLARRGWTTRSTFQEYEPGYRKSDTFPSCRPFRPGCASTCRSRDNETQSPLVQPVEKSRGGCKKPFLFSAALRGLEVRVRPNVNIGRGEDIPPAWETLRAGSVLPGRTGTGRIYSTKLRPGARRPRTEKLGIRLPWLLPDCFRQ